MNTLDKIMDSYAKELLQNHNNAREEEQTNLLTKEDFEKILKPVVHAIEQNKDHSISEIRDFLYNNSMLKEKAEDFIYKKQMAPGASISYGTKNYQESLVIGNRADNKDKVTDSTIYDLASVTKLFTSISIQMLARRGLIDLNKKVSYYLPDFPGLENVTIYQLLTFNAPVKTDGRIDKASNKEEAEQILRTITFDGENDGKRPYTDMGAMVLKYVIEKVTNMKYYEFVKENIIEPAKMSDTNVQIKEEDYNRLALTGNNGFYYKDGNYRINTDVKLGDCYDEKARIMGQKNGNLSGHAGLFSTSLDMSNLSQSLLRRELLTDNEMFHMADNETGKKGMSIQYLAKLCYSKNPVQEDSEVYHPLSGRTFASAGWTGTQVTVDPLNDIFYTLLSNRSCNRMTFIDASKKELVKTDDSGRKSIILPNGKEMIDATRYAWDRDAALVHPAIELTIQYKFLEKIYEDEEKELINEHQTKRII